MHKAPKIYHSEDRPSCFRQMIFDCAKNVHLREHATRLLLFYANQANGFSPALAFISRETGLSIYRVYELRQQLVNYGLIGYSNEKNYIHIAWNRIKAFALLEKPLRVTRNKCVFSPFTEIPKAFQKTKTLKTLSTKYVINDPRQLEEWEEDLYNRLEQLSELKYTSLVELIRQYEFPNYPATPMDVSNRTWVSCIEDD